MLDQKTIIEKVYNNNKHLLSISHEKIREILDPLTSILLITGLNSLEGQYISKDDMGMTNFISLTRKIWLDFKILYDKEEKDLNFLKQLLLDKTPENYQNIVENNFEKIIKSLSNDEIKDIFNCILNNIKFSIRYIEKEKDLFDISEEELDNYLKTFNMKKKLIF